MSTVLYFLCIGVVVLFLLLLLGYLKDSNAAAHSVDTAGIS